MKAASERSITSLFDSPPVLGLADAPLIARACEGTVFVIEAGRTRSSQATHALDRLMSVRAHLLGAVLTKLDSKSSGTATATATPTVTGRPDFDSAGVDASSLAAGRGSEGGREQHPLPGPALVALPRAARKALVAGARLRRLPGRGPDRLLAASRRVGTAHPASDNFAGIALARGSPVADDTRTSSPLRASPASIRFCALMRACVFMSASPRGRSAHAAHRQHAANALLSFIRWFLSGLGGRAADTLAAHRRCAAGAPAHSDRKQVLIYGAGVSGSSWPRPSDRSPASTSSASSTKTRAFATTCSKASGSGIPPISSYVLNSRDIDEVFIACRPPGDRCEESSERIHQHKAVVRVRVLPTLSQIASGRVSISDLREVQIEELLGRDEVAPDPVLMQRNITGRRCSSPARAGRSGASSAARSCRQRPSLIVLAEQSEHALYTIDLELREIPGARNFRSKSRRTGERGRRSANASACCAAMPSTLCFMPPRTTCADGGEQSDRRHSQQCSEHALAPRSRVNVAASTNSSLVSTDKAVRPTNVMGASKRVCELVVQARAAAQQVTSYCSVRFGNVLGSSGSVIPRFRQQIAAGGPVTITHSEATRYFMTIPEAAQLVIQAGALAGMARSCCSTWASRSGSSISRG